MAHPIPIDPTGRGFVLPGRGRPRIARLPRPASWGLALAALVLAVSLAGAGNPPTSDLPGGPIPSPRRGGTLRILQERISTLDPRDIGDVYSAVVSMQIHRGLLAYNANLNPVPDVAKSWTISRDGRTYDFELNPGILFHNNREVTAWDVVYTFERILAPGGNPGIAGQYLGVIEGAGDFRQGRTRHMSGLSASSRYELRIRLSQPDATFLWALAMNQAAIVPWEVIQKEGEAAFARMPVGCGPFRIVSNEPDMVRLVATPEYHRGRAWLDSLVFVTPLEGANVLGAEMLKRGQVDLATIPGSQRNEVAAARGLRLVSRRELTLSFLGMNTAMPPFDRLDIRRAVAMSVDRKALIAVNPEGRLSATGILPSGLPCFSPEIKTLPFDVKTAAGLVARTGHAGGREWKEIPYFTTRGTARSRMADSIMVAGLRGIGLPVNVIYIDWLEFQRRLDAHELPLFSLSWVADVPDPDSFVGTLLYSRSSNNYFRYANAAVDTMLSQGRRIVDPKTRQVIYNRLEKVALDDAPIVPLFTTTTSYGLRQDVHGFELTPLGISCVDMSHIWLEDGRDSRASF